jgi:hypothetical protein
MHSPIYEHRGNGSNPNTLRDDGHGAAAPPRSRTAGGPRAWLRTPPEPGRRTPRRRARGSRGPTLGDDDLLTVGEGRGQVDEREIGFRRGTAGAGDGGGDPVSLLEPIR